MLSERVNLKTEAIEVFIHRMKEKVDPKPGRIYESVMMEIPDMKRLIEQAEYVQDLEVALKDSRSDAQYQHDRKHTNMDRVIKLENENKRLSEALGDILNALVHDEDPGYAEEIAVRTLKGEQYK